MTTVTNFRWLWVLASVFALLLLQLAGEAVLASLEYRRSAMLDGYQWWRLASAHVVHLNFAHAAMNSAAMIIVFALVGRALTVIGWLASFVLLSLSISVGLLLFAPELSGYAGASGVVHGLLAIGCVLRWSSHRLESTLLLLGLALKVCWETYYGASVSSVELIGAPVITLAHLIGTCAGSAGALLLIAFSRWRRRAGEHVVPSRH